MTEKTKVYVFGESYYTGGAIIGIFSTEEKAKEFRANYQYDDPDNFIEEMQLDREP